MTQRTVTGTVYKPDGTPWAEGYVKFELDKGFSTASLVVPEYEVSELLDALGQFSVSLEIPDTGTATYIVTLPDEKRYVVYLGAGADTDLQTILTISTTSVEQSDLQTLMDAHVASPAAHTTLATLAVTGAASFGDTVGGDYVSINATTGTLSLVGGATTFKDLLQSLIGQKLESPSSDVTLNAAEGTLTFEDSSTILDYVIMNIQMGHDWKIGSTIYPHLHWWQASADIPNWLIQYRWQVEGTAKTTAWSPLAYTTHAFTYVSGTMNQITKFGAITPPVGASLSDIVQFRVVRDRTNVSTLFGVDPLNADVEAINFDIHYEIDGFGSGEEYIK